MSETWNEYVQRITRDRPRKEVAQAAGVDVATISRWLNEPGSQPRAEKVVSFARSLGCPPVAALVAAAYLDEDEAAEAIKLVTPTSELSDDALVKEIAARLASRRGGVADQQEGWSPAFDGLLDRRIAENPGMGGGEDGEDRDQLRS